MFSGKTLLERVNCKEYKLRSSLSFENEHVKVTCKNGLITDGASIPKFFWAIIGNPFNARYIGSAIIHDGLYSSQKMSQIEADFLFKEMLKDNNVGKARRNAMYLALKLFGFIDYKSKTPEHIEEMSKYVTVKIKN